MHEARWDSTRGPRFIVMEYLRGRSLGQELAENGRLAPRDALGIAIQILDGLAAAHAARVVHRDTRVTDLPGR